VGTGAKLNQLLKESKMSMRGLARETGIDASTISRLVNGKRQPTLEHLRLISASLHVPIAYFLEGEEHLDSAGSVGEAMDHLLAENLVPMQEIEERLEACRCDAETEAGRQTILEQFEQKLKEISGQGSFLERLKYFYNRFTERNGSKRELMLIGSVLLYFILPLDAMPDYLFPVGYIDDAIVAQIVSRKLIKE